MRETTQHDPRRQKRIRARTRSGEKISWYLPSCGLPAFQRINPLFFRHPRGEHCREVFLAALRSCPCQLPTGNWSTKSNSTAPARWRCAAVRKLGSCRGTKRIWARNSPKYSSRCWLAFTKARNSNLPAGSETGFSEKLLRSLFDDLQCGSLVAELSSPYISSV